MVVLTKVFLTTILGLERCWSKASGECMLMVRRIYCNTPEQESFTRSSVAFVEEGGTYTFTVTRDSGKGSPR